MQEEKSGTTQRLTYSTKYETSWTRRLFNTPKDLLIPSFVTLGVSRDLASATKQSDVRQYRATLTNNSFNNFGRDSFNPIFSWYEQDEVITSLTAIMKVPDDLPENTTYQISGYIQLLLQRKGQTTPAVELVKFFSKKAAELDFSISRKETLNIEISKASEVRKQVYSYAHSVEAKFLQHYTLSTGLGIDFKYFSNSANLLSLTFSIGGKAEF